MYLEIFICIYKYIKALNDKVMKTMDLKERGVVYMEGFEEKKRKEKSLNENTIPYINKKKKSVCLTSIISTNTYERIL